MPSVNQDPGRLPTVKEARHLARWVRERAENHPDAAMDDWLVAHVLQAYADGQLTTAESVRRVRR